MTSSVRNYFADIARLTNAASITDSSGGEVSLEVAFGRLTDLMQATHAAGNTILFVGNGGSASIASHLAVDYSKNGGMRAVAFNDAAALTCLGNDLGYEQVFAKQIEIHARRGDLVVAISSSGRSPNMLAAARQARRSGCQLITCSGFDEDNDLRRLGDLNFHIRSHVYGVVEIAHLTLCHAVLDVDRAVGGAV